MTSDIHLGFLVSIFMYAVISVSLPPQHFKIHTIWIILVTTYDYIMTVRDTKWILVTHYITNYVRNFAIPVHKSRSEPKINML